MNIIFLDIDGVMNCQDFYTNDKEREFKPHPLDDICPFRVSLLNDIIEKTGAKVVISSTWRHQHGAEGMQNLLNQLGFKGDVIGITPHGGKISVRGCEILEWIRSNKDLIGKQYWEYQSYAILDDDSDMLLWQANQFFHCDAYSGLTPNIAYKIVNHFNSFTPPQSPIV